MPLTPSFTAAQTPLNPALVILEDTSTGSDGTITVRRITITDSNGDYVVPAGNVGNTISWPLATNPITLNLLTQDMALNIKVEWLDGSTMVYESNNNYCFSLFNKQFLYYLIQLQSMTYNIIQDNNYWGNVGIFWTNITGAINSVEVGNDITSSQACLNRATFMAQNQANFF